MSTTIYHIVYKTTNLINNKIYIGKHSTAKLDDGYLGSGKLLIKAIKKYGKENFSREILSEHATVEAVYLEEARLVDEEFVNRKDTYNLQGGGLGPLVVSDNVRIAVAAANKKRVISEETRAKISKANKNRKYAPLTDKQKEQIRQARTGTKASEETKAKMSAAHLKRTYYPPITDKQKEQIRQSRTGTKASAETKAKMSASHLARHKNKTHK